MAEKVTLQEQKQMGLRPQRANYIPAKVGEVLPPERSIPAALSSIEHTINVPATSTQHIEVRTNSVDRAKGFLIAGVPLYAAWGVGSLIVGVLFWDLPVLSLAGLAVFWFPFLLAWGFGYLVTLITSAEGTAWYEAKRKWDVVDREQKERWGYYKRGDKKP